MTEWNLTVLNRVSNPYIIVIADKFNDLTVLIAINDTVIKR